MDNKGVQGRFRDANGLPLMNEEGVLSEQQDPLRLDIEDEELVRIIDKRIKDSRLYYKELHLYERRAENELYLFGRQIFKKEEDGDLKSYESRHLDNVLYEIEANIKPLAMSRLPDLIVTPGNDSQQSKLMATEISKAVDTDIKERNNRKVLGLAFKHLPVYFAGWIKIRWNPEIDDYIFECIHPDLMDIDDTCPTNNVDDMGWVSQICPLSVEEVVMRFPDKKADLFEQLQKDGLMVGEDPSWKLLATVIKPREIWIDYPKKHKDDEYEIVSCVIWKYKDVILGKMKNPNFDYEGETKYFSYGEEGKKEEVPAEMMPIMAFLGIPDAVQKEKVYHNYFDRPKKPYFMLGYDQWGRQPYDQTSRIEQNIQNQKTLDRRGKQIDEALDNVGQDIWSKESGLTAAMVKRMDRKNPDQSYIVDGNPNLVHKTIDPVMPTAQEFQDLSDTRERMHNLAGDNAVQGQIQSDVATTNQIARESNFTRADDLVEDTINAAAEWMASYALQMIKLRYTEDHFRWLLGAAGSAVSLKLNQNMVEEGMIVKIKASGTDKLKAQNNAMDMAKLELIDPITFFQDMGLSDPTGRAEKLLMFKTDIAQYMIKFVQEINTPQEMAQKLSEQPMPPMQPPVAPQDLPQGAMPVGGQQPMPPQPGMPDPNMQPVNPTPQNTSAVPVQPPQGAPTGSVRNL